MKTTKTPVRRLPFNQTRTVSYHHGAFVGDDEQKKALAKSRDVHMPRPLDHFSVVIEVPCGTDIHASANDANPLCIHRLSIDGPRGLIEYVADRLDALLQEIELSSSEQWREMAAARAKAAKRSA